MQFQQLSNLPPHLHERTRFHSTGAANDGQFVLYWMRTAVRVEENPALDVAITIAHELKLPVLVYHAISERYEFASDRHHTFMLEGARDVQAQFNEIGVNYVFHLATRDDTKPYLIALAKQADLVVTEEMPVDPPRQFLEALTRRVSTPILCVDTACVVPMQLIKKPYTRAFQFRSATHQLYEQRRLRPWPESNLDTRQLDLTELPLTPFDLQTASLPELVSQCEIDHSIGPVVDTVGGSTAGYDRWNKFKEKGLMRYAKLRNNPLLDGASRMSAYLHYGMVSPMRIAREAAEIDNAGSEKYLDELLIWRELAYGFCFHRRDHDQWSAIPDWAQATLEAHASDRRENVYTWEQLARAQTNDAVWNAAQVSLLRQGELHNNVRMTWGKAILNWTKSPPDALQLMIDLNHRYALDGRDPASYGGLLWCLGQFDRPFEPESKRFGAVRPRSTTAHARRLDTNAFVKRVAAPRFEPVPKVAVIGAGISGLFAARTLADHGLPVTVFDKGRGVGGRMSTRRVDGKPCFDHGAQYFTARDSRFERYVQSWLKQGIVARWPDIGSDSSSKIIVLNNGKKIEKQDLNSRFVGTPSMNAVCRHLSKELDVQTSTRIEKIESVKKGIRLIDDSGGVLGEYDRVIVSAPAAQAAELLVSFPSLADPISKIQMRPCWAVMVSFEQAVTNDWVGAFIDDSILTWAARNSTKPDRPADAEHIVLHAGHQWTSENWERDGEAIAQELLAAFWQASGLPPQKPIHIQAHRWKFAIPVDPPKTRCFFEASSGIAACGDWAGGPRVEGAFLSGMAAAGRILGTLSPADNRLDRQPMKFS
jgi:photolyase PhrII